MKTIRHDCEWWSPALGKAIERAESAAKETIRSAHKPLSLMDDMWESIREHLVSLDEQKVDVLDSL